jgi:hypothetical protein
VDILQLLLTADRWIELRTGTLIILLALRVNLGTVACTLLALFFIPEALPRRVF